MIAIELDERTMRVKVAVSFIEKDAVKAIPGSRYEDGQWTVPGTWAACLALRGTFGDRLSVGPALTAWSLAEVANRIQPCMDLRDRYVPREDCPEYDPRLKPFQRAGVQWLVTAVDALLADDLGSGKTVQTCVALKALGLRRGVVVAPKGVLGMWRDHLLDWAGLKAIVIQGTPAVRRKQLARVTDGEFDVAVIGWESIHEHGRVAGFGDIALTAKEKTPKELDALDLEFVVADEIHRGKAPRSRMTRALWNLADMPTVRHRFGLTGTPAAERIDDLWSLMRFVSPAEWPVKTKWIDRYCEIGYNQWGGKTIGGLQPTTREEFFRILDPRFRALPKAVTLPDLPPVQGGLSDPAGPRIWPCEMGSKQRKAYESLVDRCVTELDNGLLVAGGALQRAGWAQMLASAFGSVTETEGADGEIKQQVSLMEPSCKLDAMEELIDSQLDGEQAIVIFCVQRSLAEMAVARLLKVYKEQPALVIGGQTGDEREAIVARFQAGQHRFLVSTIKAGGASFTFTRARSTVYLQRDFSFVNSWQSEGRTHRIGSEIHDRVFYWDLVTTGTVESKVLKALGQKRDLAEELTRPEVLRELLVAS